MPTTSNNTANIAKCGRYAVPAPRPSDIVSGALRRAFDIPIGDSDFTALLAQIDRAEHANGAA